jgi:hypothetical protein
MRALTVEELGFVSGGFSGLSTPDMDNDFDFDFGGGCFGKRGRRTRPPGPKRKPRPPCRPKTTYITRQAGEACAYGFSQVSFDREMVRNADGTLEAAVVGGVWGIGGNVSAGGSNRVTLRMTTCIPAGEGSGGCQPDGYDMFELDGFDLGDFEFSGC